MNLTKEQYRKGIQYNGYEFFVGNLYIFLKPTDVQKTYATMKREIDHSRSGHHVAHDLPADPKRI